MKKYFWESIQEKLSGEEEKKETQMSGKQLTECMGDKWEGKKDKLSDACDTIKEMSGLYESDKHAKKFLDALDEATSKICEVMLSEKYNADKDLITIIASSKKEDREPLDDSEEEEEVEESNYETNVGRNAPTYSWKTQNGQTIATDNKTKKQFVLTPKVNESDDEDVEESQYQLNIGRNPRNQSQQDSNYLSVLKKIADKRKMSETKKTEDDEDETEEVDEEKLSSKELADKINGVDKKKEEIDESEEDDEEVEIDMDDKKKKKDVEEEVEESSLEKFYNKKKMNEKKVDKIEENIVRRASQMVI